MRERSSAKLLRFTVQADNHVADLTPLWRTGVWQHFADEGAALNVEIHRFGDIRAHFHAFNPAGRV
jgi:hypothetical protein